MKAIMILAVLLAMFGPALADEIPLGNCSVQIGIDSSHYAILPMDFQVNDDSIMALTVISKDINRDFGVLGWVKYVEPVSVNTLAKTTTSILESICARVEIKNSTDSVVVTGLAKAGGRRCWAKNVPLDIIDGQYTTAVCFSAVFDDEALNERLVRDFSARDVSC